MPDKHPIILAACAAALLALGAGCSDPPPEGAGPDIRLSTVEAYRHAGERLETVATAGEAILTPDGSEARLTDGALSFIGPALALAAPAVDVDLVADAAAGRDGVRVEGPGYTLTGAAFAIDGVAGTLAVTGGVRAQARPQAITGADDTAGSNVVHAGSRAVARTGPGDRPSDGRPSADRGGAPHGTATADTADSGATTPGSADPEAAGSAEPVDIDADQVVLHRRDNKAIFTGDVVVVRTGYRLTCRKLTVTYGADQRITHLLAEGDVKVVEEDRTITARIAEFDNVREVLTLTGDAVMVEGENVIRGERVIFHIPSDEVRVEKVRARVRMGDAGSLGSSGR